MRQAFLGWSEDKRLHTVPFAPAAVWRLGKTSLSEQGGGTILEFACATLILFSLLFGIMDGCRAIYFDHYVRYTAEEATRYAMVRGSTWNNAPCTSPNTESCTASNADVTAFAKAITPIGDANALTVTTSWSGQTPSGAACSVIGVNNAPGRVVQVNVSYNFNFIFPFLPKGTLVLASTSAVAISS